MDKLQHQLHCQQRSATTKKKGEVITLNAITSFMMNVLAPICLMLAFSFQAVAEEQAGDGSALRFDITSFTVEGASLLSADEINAAVAPYVGKKRDFSDVQLALEAIEKAYADHGYTAVQILLPEQELENGRIRFRVIESKFGEVRVAGQKYFSKENVLAAIPSLRSAGTPKPRQIAKELRLANENPARQMDVILKSGKQENTIDADVRVTEQPPVSWGLSLDNTGSPETGNTRLGLIYRNANVLDRDQVATLQAQVSPQYFDRVRVLGGSYKIPLYGWGDSVEFSGGYSTVSSLVGGLTNFQGGGYMLGAKYNHALDRFWGLDTRLYAGLDWRYFKSVEQTEPSTAILYNAISAMPVNVGYALQARQQNGETNLDISYAMNISAGPRGSEEDFLNYDPLQLLMPDREYRIARYTVSQVSSVWGDWQVRAVLSGQRTSNVLILGEQIRLGGMNGVRGFAEGSEAGEQGDRLNLECYTPVLPILGDTGRALAFLDGGKVSSSNGLSSTITSAGFGIRAGWRGYSLRLDLARIGKAGTDPLQQVGDWRAHFLATAMF